MVAADDIVQSVISGDVALEAVSREQRMAADLVRQLDAAGKPYDITKLEKQLGKVLKGEELQGALAFALATKEYDSQGLESPSQRELQRAAKQREAKAEEQAVADDAAITADLEGELSQQALFMKRLQRDTTTDRDILGSRIAASLAAEREAVAPSPAPSRRSVDLDVEVDPTDPPCREAHELPAVSSKCLQAVQPYPLVAPHRHRHRHRHPHPHRSTRLQRSPATLPTIPQRLRVKPSPLRR
jgi:hypothetical protein